MRVFEEFLVLKPVRITCIVLGPRMRHRHHDVLALDHFHQVIRRTDMVDFAVLGIVLTLRGHVENQLFELLFVISRLNLRHLSIVKRVDKRFYRSDTEPILLQNA